MFCLWMSLGTGIGEEAEIVFLVFKILDPKLDPLSIGIIVIVTQTSIAFSSQFIRAKTQIEQFFLTQWDTLPPDRAIYTG